MAIQEGVPLEENTHLARLFGSEVLGRLPTTGNERVRRTAVILIGKSFLLPQSAIFTRKSRHVRIMVHYPDHSTSEPEPTITSNEHHILRRGGVARAITLFARC